MAPLVWLAGLLTDRQQQRRRVRVLVHRGVFLVPGSALYFFIKVTNLSSTREIEITHIWFATKPPVHVLNHPERPIPARLRPDETYETWIPVDDVPAVGNVESLVRVRLSNDKVLKSRLNKNVPPKGHVGGPGIP